MLRSIVSSIEFEKFRRNWSKKNSAQRFPELSVSLLGSLEVNSASHSPWVVRQVVSHFNYEICELRRRPIGSRCIEFIIRPNFLTSNSRYSTIKSKIDKNQNVKNISGLQRKRKLRRNRSGFLVW
ncbi:hypothetical protein [Leptospira noguchii]|uniref:hypothetical protein n=1 Tax=Leptospira noguchii TaxID=28182 RepID=UPI001FB79EC6|nr:hypothetical protein [Leptospira noguchii]UOG50531.1 hypothetical protein MAL00_05560 [Leptospira noguchii]